MPNFDKTGPRGAGPKTGRGQGDCSDQPAGDKNVLLQDSPRIKQQNSLNCPRINRSRRGDNRQRFNNRQTNRNS